MSQLAGPDFDPFIKTGEARRKPKPWTRRAAYFGPDDLRKTPVYRGSELQPGAMISGPAIIEEPTTTIVVYPQMSATVSPSGHYILKS
jgi:N-methylhydantoinase A